MFVVYLLTSEKEVSMGKVNRSKVAKKAATTRAARALARKRSAVAKKAVATRRANEEFRRRSEASQRGWATRRANSGD